MAAPFRGERDCWKDDESFKFGALSASAVKPFDGQTDSFSAVEPIARPQSIQPNF